MNTPDQLTLLARLRVHFPDISDAAADAFLKLAAGEHRVEGNELGRLGLAYRPNVRHWKRWSLTTAGVRLA